MFIGHFAVGFAGKKFAPRTSLVVLLAAPLFLDLLWPVFLLFGWEHVRMVPGITHYNPLDLYDFPWSHSLLMSLVWATAFSLLYYRATRYRAGGLVIWIGVVSHWILDWVTHRPDMPLYPVAVLALASAYGNHVAATMTVEIAMLGVGVWIYASVTRARDRIGRYAFYNYAIALLILFVGDRFDTALPTVSEIIWSGLIAEAVLLVWPWWFDHHRDLRAGVSPAVQ